MNYRVPGQSTKHCIISPECIASRGVAVAFDEAVRRLKEEFVTCVRRWDKHERKPTYHLVLTVEPQEK